MMLGIQAEIKRSNNIIARVASRQEQMAKTERLYIALQFTEKNSDRYKISVNRLYAATEKPTEKKSASETEVKYHLTTETDEAGKGTATAERIEGWNTETELTRLKK